MSAYKYLIKYTDTNGERKTYMNIGFDTEDEAKKEIEEIKSHKNKMKGIGYFLNRPNDFSKFRIYHGKNFRVKKVSVLVHNLIFAKKNQNSN